MQLGLNSEMLNAILYNINKIIHICKMEYETMRIPELKALARERRLRHYSRMRKAELVALLQNNGTPEDPKAPAPRTRSPPPPPQRHAAYVTLKFDDNGCCRIHSVSDGYEEIVTTKRYVVMPWKMVKRRGNSMTLQEAVDGIFSNQDELTNSTYVTLKLGDKGRCKIHSVSEGDREIVTNERHIVMPWKTVNRHGKNGKHGKYGKYVKNLILKEAVNEIISCKESIDKERERREIECAEIEKKHAEYYKVHMKKETERLNNWVDWYEVKLNEIREAPVDSRLGKLRRLYRTSERNKHLVVTTTSAGVINLISYPEYPPELKIPEDKSLDCVCLDPCGIHEESPFCDVPLKPSPSGNKMYDWLGCFKGVVKSYRGLDEDADKYVKGAEAIIGDEGPLELERVRQAMGEIKCPQKVGHFIVLLIEWKATSQRFG